MAAVATKPVIGITTEVADARIGHWDLEWSLVPTDYVRAVQDFRAAYKEECAKANIDFVAMDTSVSFDKALMEYLVQRQRRF